MTYEKEILIVLREAGDTGLTVRKVARHVFNESNSFFNTASEEAISSSIQRYLAYHSKRSDDVIEKVSRGVYRLNMKSKKTRKLLRIYFDEQQTEEPAKAKDLSLSLF